MRAISSTATEAGDDQPGDPRDDADDGDGQGAVVGAGQPLDAEVADLRDGADGHEQDRDADDEQEERECGGEADAGGS